MTNALYTIHPSGPPVPRMPGWGELPSEAFEQRHEIKEGGREEDLLAGEEGEGAMQTVTVEDKTSDVVVWGVHGQDTRPSWASGGLTAATLAWLAERGDVQNAVSLSIGFKNVSPRFGITNFKLVSTKCKPFWID